MLTAAEIVARLDGISAAARFFGVSPPSVSEWVRKGEIPESRLLRKAALLERRVDGFDRRLQWPDAYGEIWPEITGGACACNRDVQQQSPLPGGGVASDSA